MERPDYISEQTWRWIEKARLTRRWGVLNLYTCEQCGSQLVTTDLVEGVTPFTTRCRALGCGATMVSAMYRLDPRGPGTPTHGWYRPAEIIPEMEFLRDHLEQGGLLLRELSADELAIVRGDDMERAAFEVTVSVAVAEGE